MPPAGQLRDVLVDARVEACADKPAELTELGGSGEGRAQGGHVVLQVTVPVNVQATVSLPDADSATYVSSGQGSAQFVGFQEGRAILTVGSGSTNLHLPGQS